jgi:choice-of-anchor C domain-containing protein
MSMMRTWPRRLLTGVATVALLVPTSPALGDGFEAPAGVGGFTRYETGSQVGAWTVTAGNVDLTTTALWQPAEGRQSLELDGDRPGAIARTFKTTPLLTYRISYALAGNYVGAPAVKTGELRANGTVIQQLSFDTTGSYRDSMGFVRHTAHVLAKSASLRLEFASTTAPGGFGPVIDDVRVASCVLVLCPKSGAPAA